MNNKDAVLYPVSSLCLNGLSILHIYLLTISPTRDVFMMNNEPRRNSKHNTSNYKCKFIEHSGQTLQYLSYISTFNNTLQTRTEGTRVQPLCHILFALSDILLSLFNLLRERYFLLRTSSSLSACTFDVS
jgi:hypothetical protein